MEIVKRIVGVDDVAFEDKNVVMANGGDLPMIFLIIKLYQEGTLS